MAMDNKYNQFFSSLFLLFLLGLSLYSEAGETGVKCIEREKQALLVLKKGLEDDSDILASWRDGDDNKECCEWWGIKCSNVTGHVIVLDLHTEDYLRTLKGEVSPHSLSKLKYLRYLDLSWNKFNGSQMGNFIGSLHRLKYLNLAYNEFDGLVPYQLGNITSLRSLDLGGNDLSTKNLDWLSQLHFLRDLDLSNVNMSTVNNWVQVIFNFSLLDELYLSFCSLSHAIPTSRPRLSNASLLILDLSFNEFSSEIYHWLFNVSNNLLSIDMSGNNWEGLIPDAFGQMIYLQNIDFHANKFEGGIPNSFSNLSHLRSLDLSENSYLNEPFPQFLEKLSRGAENSLESLDLHRNQFFGSLTGLTRFSSLKELYLYDNRLNGSISDKFVSPSSLVYIDLSKNQISELLPDLRLFSSLRKLHLGKNKLRGKIPESIGQLCKLEILDLSFNSLEGTLTEIHFSKLSNLKKLKLSFNRLSLKMSPEWNPAFRLDIIRLANCSMGIQFPKWMRTQHNFSELDLSSASISDTLPNWFSNLSRRLKYLNLSHNEISGRLPGLSQMFQVQYSQIDLSSNNFSGPILSVPPNLQLLLLNKNRFVGSISFLCECTGGLHILDLSDNLFSGNLHNCWMNMEDLAMLNLGNNKFSGQIPKSFIFLKNLRTLNLHGNSFIGRFPTSLRDFRDLIFIDIGGNKLTGNISDWIRGIELPILEILSIRSNKFSGSIPQDICHLSSLHVLDLSQNNITGKIPQCLFNLPGLSGKNNFFGSMGYGLGGDPDDELIWYNGYMSISLQWKRQDSKFKELLEYQGVIDLSSNKLDGHITQEIASLDIESLTGLVSLNLSGNHLTGTIMEHIDKMKMLESLDLSRNLLSGEIPAGIARLTFLSVLDLSYNNLSGRIPSSTQLHTFDASIYFGNKGLCGVPLEKCPGDDFNPPRYVQNEDEDHDTVTKELHISIGIGFVSGLCGVLLILLKGSWRNAYFVFMQNTYDWLYVRSCVYWARLMRMFSG